MRNYGLPYQGSKNRLAERIVALFPKRKHLVDLFCGGCAVTHAAMQGRKFEDFAINDINWMCPELFVRALRGEYANETRWISHEDFDRLKDSDPYVAFVWSFGNDLRSYLYSKDIEPVKRAIHYAIFFHDYEPSRELGFDLSFIEAIGAVEERYLAVKRYFRNSCGGYKHLESWSRTRRIQTCRAFRRQEEYKPSPPETDWRTLQRGTMAANGADLPTRRERRGCNNVAAQPTGG